MRNNLSHAPSPLRRSENNRQVAEKESYPGEIEFENDLHNFLNLLLLA